MNLSKFTFNKKILSGIVTFFFKKNFKNKWNCNLKLQSSLLPNFFNIKSI